MFLIILSVFGAILVIVLALTGLAAIIAVVVMDFDPNFLRKEKAKSVVTKESKKIKLSKNNKKIKGDKTNLELATKGKKKPGRKPGKKKIKK